MLKQSNQGKLLLQGLKLPSIYSLKKWFILYVQRTAETFLNDTLLYKEKLHSAYILIIFFFFFHYHSTMLWIIKHNKGRL